MTESINIYNGNGKIKIKGNATEAHLFINQKPQIGTFLTEIGTTWRYLIGTEITCGLLQENYEYEDLVCNGKVDANLSLHEQFNFILKLLSNGNYQLDFCKFPFNVNFLPANSLKNSRPYYDTYGGLVDIIETQTFIDRNIIEKYKSKIINGQEPIPILLTIQNSTSVFILDGHHKINAYRELKKNPKALIISKIGNKDFDLNEGVTIMKSMGLDDKKITMAYQREKENKHCETNSLNYSLKNLLQGSNS